MVPIPLKRIAGTDDYRAALDGSWTLKDKEKTYGRFRGKGAEEIEEQHRISLECHGAPKTGQ
jgi:hypothetical protein